MAHNYRNAFALYPIGSNLQVADTKRLTQSGAQTLRQGQSSQLRLVSIDEVDSPAFANAWIIAHIRHLVETFTELLLKLLIVSVEKKGKNADNDGVEQQRTKYQKQKPGGFDFGCLPCTSLRCKRFLSRRG